MRSFLSFAGKVAVAHLLTYVVVGAASYQLLTKHLYIGEQAPFASFMRTEADPGIWGHVLTWFVPAQILRGLVIAAVLFPFLPALQDWLFTKRWLAIAGVYIGVGYWAATVAAPGTIEGLVYLRPEITPDIHLEVQPEIILQGLAMAALVARWISPKPEG